MLKKIFPISLLTLLLLAMFFLAPNATPPASVQAQDGADITAACQTTVRDALRLVGSSCATLGSNEICYGNQQIRASLAADDIVFNERGDIVAVSAIESLVTAAANPDTDEWGVALINLTADLPAELNENVRMVLFGGMTLEPEPQAQTDELLTTCTFESTIARGTNMRSGPGTEFAIVDRFAPGESVEVYASSADGEWVRSARGWMAADLGRLACQPGVELPSISQVSDAYTAPMQAFAVRIDETGQCENAPQGMLIQAPDNVVANVLVNGVELRVGSTASVTFEDDGSAMWLGNIEGEVAVTFNGFTHSPQPGEGVAVSLDDDFRAIGDPVEPAFNMGLRTLRGFEDEAGADLLPRAIEVEDLLDDPRIDMQINTASGVDDDDDDDDSVEMSDEDDIDSSDDRTEDSNTDRDGTADDGNTDRDGTANDGDGEASEED